MRTRLFIFFVSLSLLYGCFSPPEFPNEPIINFEDIGFVRGDQVTLDSLILTIYFTDGDGDLGLSPNEISPPYNDLFAFNRDDGSGRFITYTERFTPPWDTLPAYEFPYNCLNYLTPQEHGIEEYVNDTIYVQANEDHFNIFIEYFVKVNGQFTEFDWETAFEPQCTDSYNGRFPVLGDLSGNRPLEGKLRYGMTSAGFSLLFRNDTLKLRVRIKDRALNDSNIIETPEFVLGQIENQ